MIKFADLLLEKFELPSALQKQLENTGYSALGHILPPHFEKLKKKLLQNRDLNQKSYSGIKNVMGYIKKLTEGGGNTKLTLTDLLVPEYYSTNDTKESLKKGTVTIEKEGNQIYVECKDKKETLFSFVISKDYAGWDLGQLNQFWNKIDDSYKDFEKEFDEKLVSMESISKKVNGWKSMDKAKKPKFKEPNLVLVFEKTVSETGQPYEHYFRAFNFKKDDESKHPDYFSSTTPPRIVQTIILEHYDILKFPNYFDRAVSIFIGTSRHEGRHLLQHVGNINNKLRGDYYGGPKKSLKHQYNPDLRGSDFSGTASPTTKFKDTEDPYKRVIHPFRDVEFKTNLYNYKEEIEDFLKNNVPKNKWREGFNDAVRHAAGSMDYNSFRKKYPFSSVFSYSTVISKHFKELFKHDRPKFNQFVKELYKLIFGG
jgi:hypothetical protein